MRLLCLFVILLAPLWAGQGSGHRLLPMVELRGIDVSHHQKQIEWDTVTSHQQLDFAFVKATEGSDFCDSLFSNNWSQLRRLGIRRGAYHFFRAYGCGLEQAAHFLQTVDMQPGDFAPVLDIETCDEMPDSILIQEARVWLQTIEQALGIRPIVYSNLNFYEKHLAGHLDDYPLWVARYSDQRPALESGKAWHFWQYSNQGCLEGIGKKVDLNMFVGTTELLQQLCWQPKEELAGP